MLTFSGVEVWRIEKFKVVLWPKERYGEFYTGDSYIVLNVNSIFRIVILLIFD